MKKTLIAAAVSLFATASFAQAACIVAGDGKMYCGEVVIRY